MSSLFPTYAKWNVHVKQGKGATLIDDSGKKYIDFVAGIGVCNLGHCHPNVISAVKQQLDQLWHASNLFQLEGQEQVATKLAEESAGDLVFFLQ